MIFTWLRQRRRAKLLATPFPEAWLGYLRRNLTHYRFLSPEEQAKLRDDLRVFVAEKNWEGCGGLTVTEEMQVTIAAHACLMTLALEGEPFRNVLSVLIYPAGYAVPEERWHGGWSIAGQSARLGEAWYRGPVILSWEEIKQEVAASRPRQQPGVARVRPSDRHARSEHQRHAPAWKAGRSGFAGTR